MRLHALVEDALRAGPVVVYACWAGGEADPPAADEHVNAGWLLRKTAPLKEGVRYTVTGSRPSLVTGPPSCKP